MNEFEKKLERKTQVSLFTSQFVMELTEEVNAFLEELEKDQIISISHTAHPNFLSCMVVYLGEVRSSAPTQLPYPGIDIEQYQHLMRELQGHKEIARSMLDHYRVSSLKYMPKAEFYHALARINSLKERLK